MLEEWELFAVADHARQRYGVRAPVFIAEMVGACAVAGDAAGVETWKAIAARYEALRKAPRAD